MLVECLEGIKSGCKKVIDFSKSVNVWYLLQPPRVFHVNKGMSDINKAVQGMLEIKWRTEMRLGIKGEGK